MEEIVKIIIEFFRSIFILDEDGNLRKEWQRRISGTKTIDKEFGCGFYLQRMKKGDSLEIHGMIYEIIESKYFRDPPDQLEYAYLQAIGIKGKPVMNNCTFEEFKSIYGKYFSVAQKTTNQG